jgi:excisionase family DNA binding protein
MQTITPAFLRPKDAAAYLSMGLSTFYRLIESKKVRVKKVAGVRLISRVELEQFVESCPSK